MEEIEFDHERATPSLYHENKMLYYYHLSRYQFASLLIEKNEEVLDIACGTGYGTYELALKAKKVIGIDISEKAVNYAQKRFGAGNIEYIVENATTFHRIISQKINTCVSFETIEHLDEDEQEKFLENVVSVLDANGVFIVSTPNKSVYSSDSKITNEFHKRELSLQEFETVLKSRFNTVLLYGQKLNAGYDIKKSTMQMGSLLRAIFTFNLKMFKRKSEITLSLSDFEFTNIDVHKSLIIIAICKNPKMKINY